MISHCTNGDMSKHLLFMKFLVKLSFIIIFYQCYLYMSIIIIIFIIIVLAFWPLIFTLLLLLWILFMLTLMGVYIMLYHLSYYIKKMIKGKSKINYDNSLVDIIKLLNFEYHCQFVSSIK